jgi:hypothetical protein
MVLLLALLTLSSGIIYAQTDQLPPLAAVTDRQLTLYNINGGAQQIMRAEVLPFDNLVWSPDGQWLAFTAFDAAYQPMLMLTDRNGSAPVTLTSDAYILPQTFSADSARIWYAGKPGEQVDSSSGLPTFRLDVIAQELRPDAPREVIGQIAFGTGCGGGSPYPMDTVYNIEAGYGGSNLIFANTSGGLLYSHNCAGRGLSLLNVNTGEITDLGDALHSVALSPDRTQVAALDGGNIVAIDLASGQRRAHGAQVSPDQVAWGADNNTVYYSVRTLLDTTLPLSEEEAQAFANWTGIADFSIPQYSVSVRSLNLNSGADQLIYEGPGWAVGRMFTSRSALYFSVVPNGEGWVEAVASGTLDLSSTEGIFQERASVTVTMLRVALAGGEAVEIAQDIRQATPHPSAR